MDPNPRGPGLVAVMNKFIQYRSPVETKGQHGSTLSEREVPESCLDRLLLIFWVHYMEESPHLLCTGSLYVIAF